MKPARGDHADRLEVIFERRIPVGRRLREQTGIVDGERLAGFVNRLVGQQIREGRPAEARGPARSHFQVPVQVVVQVNARKRLGVAAFDLAPGVRVVALRRADRIGLLLRRGAARAGAHPAGALGIRALGTNAGEESGRADPALRHHVAGGDTLRHFAGADVPVGLEKVPVFAPELGLFRLARADEVRRLPLGDHPAGLELIVHHQARGCR